MYAANRSIFTCDSTRTSTSGERYVRFSFFNIYLTTYPTTGGIPPSRAYLRLCNLHPDFDVVLRFSVHAVSIQRAQDGASRKGTWEGCWTVGCAEHRRRRDQVHRCCHRCRLNVDISSDLWYKASLKHRLASQSRSMARSSRQMCTRHHIRPPNPLVPASYQDGEGVRSWCSSVFGWA